jgi:hypothetical protein
MFSSALVLAGLASSNIYALHVESKVHIFSDGCFTLQESHELVLWDAIDEILEVVREFANHSCKYVVRGDEGGFKVSKGLLSLLEVPMFECWSLSSACRLIR